MTKILISDSIDNITSNILLNNNIHVDTKLNLSPNSVNQINPKVPLFLISNLPVLSELLLTKGCLLRGCAKSVAEYTIHHQ